MSVLTLAHFTLKYIVVKYSTSWSTKEAVEGHQALKRIEQAREREKMEYRQEKERRLAWERNWEEERKKGKSKMNGQGNGKRRKENKRNDRKCNNK